MNEQIRECWLKAAKEDSGEKWDTQEEFIERFAKLIVQSCISEVAMMGVTNFENKDITWAVDVIIKNIKSRWGVEQ
jgi:hypothetical protein